MTNKQAFEKGYTNEGQMFGFIPVFWKDVEYDCFQAEGKNKFWDLLLDVLMKIDLFLEFGCGFQIWDGGLIKNK